MQRKTSVVDNRVNILSAPRSGKWARIREEHLKIQNCCQICGGTDLLQVHHVEPFANNPENELNPKNLVTLCEGKFRCHFIFGHLFSWRTYNPEILRDIERIKNRPTI